MAWWLMPRTPDPEVGVRAPLGLNRVVFTPQKVLVIPRKRWLRPNMTEKLFTGTLRINQPTNQLNANVHYKTFNSVVKPKPKCGSGIGFQFYIPGTKENIFSRFFFFFVKNHVFNQKSQISVFCRKSVLGIAVRFLVHFCSAMHQ